MDVWKYTVGKRTQQMQSSPTVYEILPGARYDKVGYIRTNTDEPLKETGLEKQIL